MTRRTQRLAIAIALTIVDLVAFNYYCGVIWQAFAEDLFAKAVLLGLLCLWVATAAVMWLHVAHDMRQVLRERDNRLALECATAPAEPRSDRNV